MSMQVDHAEIKTGQLMTIVIAVAAYVAREPILLAVLGGFFLLTALYRPLSPFVIGYRLLIKPLGLMKSDYRLDNIEAHTFGQIIGAFVAGVCVALLYAGYTVTGWTLAWVLVGLTLISYLGWCIGCFIYYQLNRIGLRGFFRHAPADKSVFPGQRPRK